MGLLIRWQSVMQNYSDRDWLEYIFKFRLTDPEVPEVRNFLIHFNGLPANSLNGYLSVPVEAVELKPPKLVLGWLIDTDTFCRNILKDTSYLQTKDYDILVMRAKQAGTSIEDLSNPNNDIESLMDTYIEFICLRELGYSWTPQIALVYGRPEKADSTSEFRWIFYLHDSHEPSAQDPRVVRDLQKIKRLFGFATEPVWYVSGGSLHWSPMGPDEAHLWD